MGEKDLGSPTIHTQTEIAPELVESTHKECREACAELDRSICLDKLINDLAIACSPEERAALIPLLIEQEKSLPKPLTQLPPPIAMIQIAKMWSLTRTGTM